MIKHGTKLCFLFEFSQNYEKHLVKMLYVRDYDSFERIRHASSYSRTEQNVN